MQVAIWKHLEELRFTNCVGKIVQTPQSTCVDALQWHLQSADYVLGIFVGKNLSSEEAKALQCLAKNVNVLSKVSISHTSPISTPMTA